MIVNSEFSPAWWLSNPHLQTIYASKLGRRATVHLHHERLELPDGDFLDLAHTDSLADKLDDWVPVPAPETAADPESGPTAGPRVLIFHGLAGCSRSAYVQGLAGALVAQGWRATLMHWRGCSGEPNRLARSYHSGETGDIATIVNEMQRREPGTPLYAVGYSLGGNALLKYLGEQGTRSPLAGAVAVCPPLQLSVGADTLNRGFARLYQRYLIGLLCRQHESKRQRYPELDLPPTPSRSSSFWEFDDLVTAPLHGFSGVHEYYDRCSARAWLPGITCPTRIVYALDDPFFSARVLPESGSIPAGVELELAERGGHVGFVGSTRSPAGLRNGPVRTENSEFWLDGHVAHWLTGLHMA